MSGEKLHEQGVALFRKGKFQAALEKLEQALAGAAGDTRRMAEIYNDIGVIYKQLENYPAAHQALDEAWTRFTELTDKKGQAQTLGNRAAVYEAEDLLDEAVDAYKQSATMLEEVGENEMAMYVWQAVSRLRMHQGQYIAAIGAYEEGIENIPEGSLKKKILQQILKLPGSLLGGPGKGDKPDQDD
ncbi:MAG: tetratricopeptide repeat protein [Anaerolineae bacterium]|nr:tetratricopeptide repeat protein [Anaerolineae bacterium]